MGQHGPRLRDTAIQPGKRKLAIKTKVHIKVEAGGPFGNQAVALLTGYVWFDWAIKLPIDVVEAGINAISLLVLNLGTLESAVVGYSGGDIMSP